MGWLAARRVRRGPLQVNRRYNIFYILNIVFENLLLSWDPTIHPAQENNKNILNILKAPQYLEIFISLGVCDIIIKIISKEGEILLWNLQVKMMRKVIIVSIKI